MLLVDHSRCAECDHQVGLGDVLCRDCASMSAASDAEDLRVAAACDDFDGVAAGAGPQAGRFRIGSVELFIAGVALILMAALVAIVVVPGSNGPTSSGLLQATALAMDVRCVGVANPTPVQLDLSAYTNENPALRTKVTGTSFCIAANDDVGITAITLKPGTDSLGEITENLTQLDSFETIYGADWVVAISAVGYPTFAARSHPLAQVAKDVGGWRWETGGNSGEPACAGWITSDPRCH